MPGIVGFDHVGVNVRNLAVVTEFFVALGLEVQGRVDGLEGEFLDTVCGIPEARTSIVMLKAPGAGVGIELSSFERPAAQASPPAAPPNELGLRTLAFHVDDLHAVADSLQRQGYELIGGIGEYESTWRMAYVRGPENLIVALAERL